jgi:UDP-GlcNAc:undecaprenyl-phosphate GlcNAc-1-phosphate transferase
MLTPLAIRLARKLHSPDGGSAEETSPPLLGGPAIYLAFAVSISFVGLTKELGGFLLASVLIVAIGVMADLGRASGLIRLAVQVAAVMILIRSGVVLTMLPPTWWGIAAEWGLTFLWILAITNAFRLLDGLEGLAAGSAAVNGFFFGVYGFVTGQGDLALVAFVLMGAALGFLPYSYKPHHREGRADILLGAGGSSWLGFALASIVVMGDWLEQSPNDLLFPLLILAIPISDMIVTAATGFREGLVRNLTDWIVSTNPNRVRHRLLSLGIRKKEAVAIFYLVNTCLGISAFLLEGSGLTDAILVLGQVAIIFGIIAYAATVMKKRRGAPEGK